MKRENIWLAALIFALAIFIIVSLLYYRQSAALREARYYVEELQQTSPRASEVHSLLDDLNQNHVIIQTGYLVATLIMLAAAGGLYFTFSKTREQLRETEARIRSHEAENGASEANLMELRKRLAKASETIQKTNSEFSAFSYSISHDLRAPLRAINGFSGILLDEHSGNLTDSGRQALLTIQQNAKRMNDLINDLLDLARVGTVPLTKQAMDMESTVKQALAKQVGGQSIEVSLCPMPRVVADPHLIRQLWDILIDNAIKFSSKTENPKIAISYQRKESEHVYAIKDNGVGFDPAYSDKLFKLFSRLHGKKEFEGTGGGLAIARKIVEAHDGKIWAYAELSKGATFYFSLPE